MKNKTHRSSSSASSNAMRSNFASRFVQRFTNAADTRARFPVPPLGSLWDPYLLDRLHAPLTRHRE
jgi:hypothetical protein